MTLLNFEFLDGQNCNCFSFYFFFCPSLKTKPWYFIQMNATQMIFINLKMVTSLPFKKHPVLFSTNNHFICTTEPISLPNFTTLSKMVQQIQLPHLQKQSRDKELETLRVSSKYVENPYITRLLPYFKPVEYQVVVFPIFIKSAIK